MAVLSSSILHWLSLVASHPAVTNSRSMGAAGWSRAGLRRATRLTNAFVYLLWCVESSCSSVARGLGLLRVVQGVFVGLGHRSWCFCGHVWEGVVVHSGVEWDGRLLPSGMMLELCCWADLVGTDGCVG